MGRRNRVDAPGTWHHVMNRGAGRRIVFRDDRERARFIELLGFFADDFGVEVHCYCLMGNHYHLLVRSCEGRLSEAMKWLGAQFTKFTNSERGVDGAVFRGRFHSVQVVEESHLCWLFRYINSNPLELGWSAPLVEYPWSGLAASVGHSQRTPWLCTDYSDHRFAGAGQLESFVESARGTCADVAQAATLTPQSLSEREINTAVRVARLEGPGVSSDVDVGNATIVIAVDHLGLDTACLEATAHLGQSARRRAVVRARQRVVENPEVSRLVQRTIEVLALGQCEPSGV